MGTPQTLRVHTLSPVRSPFSSYSEQRAAGALVNSQQTEQDLEALDRAVRLNPLVTPFEWPWKRGYGTLDHDNLPQFFQPLYCFDLSLPENMDTMVNLQVILETWGGRINCCELFLYDDTVALLRLDVTFDVHELYRREGISSEVLDNSLSNAAREIYEVIVHPLFVAYSQSFPATRRFRKAPEPTALLRNPKALTVFKDLCFDDASKAPGSNVLWTGRYIIVPPTCVGTELGRHLKSWASCTLSDSALRESTYYVGSGNILILSDEEEDSRSDWFRGLSICQFYNGVLTVYNGILKAGYSELTEYLDASGRRAKKLSRLMVEITRSLDHLEFTRLEFSEARVGVQAERAIIVEQTSRAWQLDLIISTALERTGLIRARISRLLEDRKAQLNRSVELILSGIAGVALIDLFISLVVTSRSLNPDGIPGLLDLFKWTRPDTSIGLSLVMVLLLSAYIYRIKR